IHFLRDSQSALRLFTLLPLGHIARDLCETAKIAVDASDRGDDGISPEFRSIFAYAPARILDSALPARLCQELLRLARANVFRGIENREVLSDDLFRLVTFDPPCA